MHVQNAAKRLFNELVKKNLLLVTAESLTAGLIGSEITRFPGSSKVFWGGMVVYAPEAKTSLLGVPSALITTCGVVSTEVAKAMALGALEHSPANVSVAVTGLASAVPKNDQIFEPKTIQTGTVWIAVGIKNKTGEFSVYSKQFIFSGKRRSVRKKTVRKACEQVLCYLDRV